MSSSVKILSALAEPARLNALRLLWKGKELCVCELMAKIGATQSRMSRHMAVLKTAGLVSARREAQWIHYSRNRALSSQAVALVDAALAVLKKEGKRK